jgi:hypothetical protein
MYFRESITVNGGAGFVDKETSCYPSTSGYAYVANNPVMYIDTNGCFKADGYALDVHSRESHITRGVGIGTEFRCGNLC